MIIDDKTKKKEINSCIKEKKKGKKTQLFVEYEILTTFYIGLAFIAF